ncbi:MAG: carboxypeptidase-like regulatory domain-containing protein [Thermoanaerobaculia bacterium]
MKRSGRRAFARALVLAVAAWGLPLLAQPMGTIRGVVFSADGKPVPSASVKAGSTVVAADKNGLFLLKVRPGKYDVVASQKGFSSDTIAGVEVKAGTIKEVSAVLLPK